MILTRPIITFDLETTGVSTSESRIVQIAAIKRNIDGTTETKNVLINPTIPIPKEATEVHGITDEIVKDAPAFSRVAVKLKEWFKDCDISGFNSDSYDIPLISAEFDRLGLVFIDWDVNFVDVLSLYRKLYPNKLTDIYKRLFGVDFDNAHDALSDVIATDAVCSEIIKLNFENDVTPKEIDDLIQGARKRFDIAGKIYINENGIHCWSFGKNIDKPITQDIGFANWVLSKDFPIDTKEKIKMLIK